MCLLELILNQSHRSLLSERVKAPVLTPAPHPTPSLHHSCIQSVVCGSVQQVVGVLWKGYGYATVSLMLLVDRCYGSQGEHSVQGDWNRTQQRMQGGETER